MSARKRFAVGLTAALVVVLGVPAAAQADDEPPAPTVTTLTVTDVTGTTAAFHARITTNNTVTIGHFVYGTAPDQLTQRTPDRSFVAAPGEVALDAAITCLSVNTMYYVVAVVENDDRIVTGGLVSFSTPFGDPWRVGE
jgi:hypothetical protein